MFKVVPFWEFCMLVNSMFLLKFCQISVLRSLVFLTVCSSLILLGFSFMLFKKSHFWGINGLTLQVKFFTWGKCVFFGFVLKFNIFNIHANFQYLYKSLIFVQIFNICIKSLVFVQILNISCTFLRTFVLLSLVCVQVDLCLTSGVRER